MCLGIYRPRLLLPDHCSVEELRPSVDKCYQDWVDHQVEETKTTQVYPKISYNLWFCQQRRMAQRCNCALTHTKHLALVNHGQAYV